MIVVTWNVVVVCIVATFLIAGGFIAGVIGSAGNSEPIESFETIYGEGQKKLLSIPIEGVIVGTDNSSDGWGATNSGQTFGYSVKDQLYRAADNKDIKGVILEVDSPGGTIYGAHAITDGVKYYREKTKNPVYAVISGTGASGAYWAATSADKIFIDYGSGVGSIGVIMGPFEYYDKVTAVDGGILGGGVVTQNGIQSLTITAGKSKDLGNPYRKLTDVEIAALQKTVNNEYDGFVSYVSGRRDIPEATIREQIGAMEYDPKSAVELKLVDAIGSRHDAYNALAEAGKIKKDDFSIVRQKTYDDNIASSFWGAITHRPQPKAEAKSIDLCSLSQVSLAYRGDVSQWCAKQDQ